MARRIVDLFVSLKTISGRWKWNVTVYRLQTGYARTRATMGHAEVHGAQVGLPRPWPPTSDPDRSANLTGESRAPADRSRSPWRGHSHDEDFVVTMDPRDEETWKGKAKGLARGRGHWGLIQKGKGHPLHRVWQPFPTSYSGLCESWKKLELPSGYD